MGSGAYCLISYDDALTGRSICKIWHVMDLASHVRIDSSYRKQTIMFLAC